MERLQGTRRPGGVNFFDPKMGNRLRALVHKSHLPLQ